MLKTKPFRQNEQVFHVPVGWSDNAATIFVAKYCRSYSDKHGEPDRSFSELSVMRVFQRLVKFWTRSKSMRNKLFQDLWNQVASPNSPQYFNAGIYTEYQVAGNDIGLWKSDKSGKAIKSQSTFIHPQLHACFIQPIEDSIPSIMSLLTKEARLFSRGSGTGTNFSDLRGKEERVSGGGGSSGLISFLEVFDKMAGAIKSGGTTRRAAKMVVVDVDHPDIMEFINWKRHEEDKAKVLGKEGYGTGWQSESYKTVSGQNSNNSVSIPDLFMFALDTDGEWQLKGRCDPLANRSLPAKRIWSAICNSAWHCADPGIHYTDTINEWNTTPNDGKIRASNPCSEHLRLDNSACNLASINLNVFYDPETEAFSVGTYVDCIRRWTEVLDNSIDLAGYPSRGIAETTHRYRDIGLGYCGLGSLLVRLRLPYDSDIARLLTSLLTSLLTAVAYERSAELARKHNVYSAYRGNRSEHLAILSKHLTAFQDLKLIDLPPHVQETVDELFDANDYHWHQAYQKAKDYGLRNAQMTVIAPTGTIGITMDSQTTGIEPLYDTVTIKTLAGGGQLHQSPSCVQEVLDKLGVKTLDDVTDEHRPIFASAVNSAYGNVLSPEAHLNMVAAAQPFISGGISKTVNLPASATVADIDRLYRKAYKLGIKCISVYRDGSKAQPLTSECKKCGDDESCEIG